MSKLDALAEAIAQLHQQLDAIDPDPQRTEWAVDREAIDAIERQLAKVVLPALDEAKDELDDPDKNRAVRAVVGHAAASVAALYYASGLRDHRSWLSEALQLTDRAPEIQAAYQEPLNFALYNRGQWLINQKRAREGQKLLDRVAKATQSVELATAAQGLADGPVPLDSAPTMATFNGFGAMLYGHRDEWDDGTFVATHFLVALFIPVLPLAAYRVADHGGGSFTFFAKQRLGVWARIYRALALVGVLAGGAAFGIATYLQSPSRRVAVALEAAAALETAGDRNGAITAYEGVIHEFANTVPVAKRAEAATALVPLYAADIDGEVTLTTVPKIEQMAERFSRLPRVVRSGDAANLMVSLLGGWAEAIGSDTPKSARAQLLILDRMIAVSPPSKRGGIREAQAAIRIGLGDAARDQWPIEALTLYLAAGSDAGTIKAGAIVDALGDQPALLLASEPMIAEWISLVGHERADADRVTKTKAAIEKARLLHADEARTKLLRAPTEKTLRRHLRAAPWDQSAAAALASIQHGRGKQAKARAIFDAFGGAGWLAPEALQTLAAILVDEGELARAEEALKHFLAGRLPMFRSAGHEIDQRVSSIEDGFINSARSGNLPPDLMKELNAASEDDQSRIFGTWVNTQIVADPHVAALREKLQMLSDVVSASLMLGMVKLRRANQTKGAERERLLAEAEQTYLAIQQSAAGVPSFHLGLGQVYHRLGKSEAGEREFKTILDAPDVTMHLEVASAYRELGQSARAATVAKAVFDRADTLDFKSGAAIILAMLATTQEEREKWLSAADQKSAFVRTQLLDVRAHLALREGRFEDADKMFAQVAEQHENATNTGASGANNAALAYTQRYVCSGDPRHLEKSVALLDRALGLEPESAIIVGNLSDHLTYLGHIEVLSRWIDPKLVRLSEPDASTVIDLLSSGPLRAEVMQALEENRALRRALELARRGQALAPDSPGPYWALHNHAARAKRLDQLEKLHAQIEGVAAMDSSRYLATLEAWIQGERDVEGLAEIESNAARHRASVARAERARDGHSIAVAKILLSGAIASRSGLKGELEDAEGSLAILEEAAQHWTDAKFAEHASGQKISVAVLSAIASSPALEKHWSADHRRYGSALTLLRALESEDGPVIKKALAQQPLIRAVIDERKKIVDDDPSLMDWTLAKLTDDAGYEKRAAALFADEVECRSTAIGALLAPSDNAKLRQQIFAANAVK